MSTNRATIDTRGNTIRGPWEEPVRGGLPVPTDPRLELSDQALVVASQNAYPIVARQKTRRDSVGLAAGAAIALVLGVATFVSLSSSRHTATTSTALQPAATATRAGAPMVAAAPAKPALAPPAATALAPQHATVPGVVPVPPSALAPAMNPAASPVLVYDGGSAPSPAYAPAPGTKPNAEGTPTLLAGATPSVVTGVSGASAHATKLADPANTVVQGTLIPAVLETAINTDVPGYARAVVSQDVRSFDGSKVLIPRSSRLIGEYKGVTEAGQRRAYLMWTRLVRPDGVSIALASPAADFAGEAGIGGKVDSHFFSRFGSSILLSILGGAGSLFTGGASTVVVSGGQSAASVAAQRDSTRPPTIKVQQGAPIRVFTARDLIFSDGAAG